MLTFQYVHTVIVLKTISGAIKSINCKMQHSKNLKHTQYLNIMARDVAVQHCCTVYCDQIGVTLCQTVALLQ